MKMNKQQIKEYAILTLKVVGIFAGCAAFFFGMWVFMWACYYAGIPM